MISRTNLKNAIIGLSLALCLQTGAVGQEIDYNDQQYGDYTKAVQEPDPDLRLDKILDFVRANPEISLVSYALNTYVQTMQELQGTGEQQKVLTAAERLLAFQPENANALMMGTVAAFQLQNFQQAVNLGEKAYAANPNAGLLYVLAVSYQNLKNSEKLIQYGQQIIDALEPGAFLPGHFQIASGLRGTFVSKQDWAKAAAYARKIIAALDAAGTPEGTTEANWQNYSKTERALSYAVIGQNSVKTKNWAGAVSAYQRVLQSTADANMKAESFYYIGRGRWEQNRLEPAMEAFAKGSIYKGPNAEACYKLLERLYRSTHNDSTAGLDEFIDRVTGR